ncbi:hypothetical protein [Pseudomonas sp. Fl5BN2]|nr:hypothetical protein [Pseudomonas sp. Fl5BN2]
MSPVFRYLLIGNDWRALCLACYWVEAARQLGGAMGARWGSQA